MKIIILFLILLNPISLFANPYLIKITNSGKTNNLVIIPTTTSYPCFSAPEGLSVSGDVAYIPPDTTAIYNFALPSNILLECATIIKINSGFPIDIVNKYVFGTTLTNAIYGISRGLGIQYEENNNQLVTWNIFSYASNIPPYLTFSPDGHSMTVNADMIPPIE